MLRDIEDAKREIDDLTDLLNYHCYRYYVLDSPEITDEEYDMMYSRLKALEDENGYFREDSPTRRVGHKPLDRFQSVRHNEPMLSLENAFDHGELRDFDQRIRRLLGSDNPVEYTVEPKYDGLAVELTYHNGIFSRASTRGDGFNGEDITQNIKTIMSVPLRIEGADVPEEIDLRGEVYMYISDFESLNQERVSSGEQPFANPRNAAAGSVRQLDPSVTSRRKLHIVFYGIGISRGREFASQQELINWLRAKRFSTPQEFRIVKGIDEAINQAKRMEEIRSSLPFEIDGAVIKVNAYALQRLLGSKTREPRWAVAYKFQSHKAATRIIDIQPSVGRTGQITPIALLQPVKIGGVMVSRSTLHNWDEVERKDIRIGDKVEVERAGDVIPHVLRVLKEDRTGQQIMVAPPKECPVCGSHTIREGDESALRCVNINCEAQAIERIKHFASKGAMDIEGLGEKTVELLFQKELARHFIDLFSLKTEDLLSLPGFAEKSAQKLINSVAASKSTTLARFIFSLGIIHVGEFASRLIARYFKCIEELYHIRWEILREINQIGEKTAQSISSFFETEENIRTIERLKELGLNIDNPDYNGGVIPRDELTIVITGTHRIPRNEIQEMIRGAGWKTSETVSRKTNYVVAGSDPGSKLRKASELGIQVIDLDGLIKLIGSIKG